MARFYFSVDMEGLSGMNAVADAYPTPHLHQRFETARELLADLLMDCCGILDHHFPDAEIWINDAHNTMTNLTVADIPETAQLISGKPKPCAMMAGLNKAIDGVMLIGYHGKAGSHGGVLAHSFHPQIFEITLNGQSIGETAFNTLYANVVHQVPVLFGVGDRSFCEEVRAFPHPFETLETKHGLSATAAQHLDLMTLHEQLHQKLPKVLKAMKKKASPNQFLLEGPYTLEVTFCDPQAADWACLCPCFERIDGRRIRYESQDFSHVYRALQTSYTLLAASPGFL